KRHRLKALTAELSRIGLPRLCAILASVTLPLPGSTVTRHTPLPVMCLLRASYGYSGRGALIATAFAWDALIIPGGLGGPVTCGALIGVFAAGLFCFGGVCSSWNSG